MPTYKKGCGRNLEAKQNENNLLNFYDYKDEDLIKYLKEKNYLLIIKRHPSDEFKYKIINNENIREITNEMLSIYGLNVNSILNAGDLLITDYSSVGIEFAFLDRPVIYVTTDIEEYKKNRGIILNNFDFWTDGITVNKYKQLLDLIENLINKKYIHRNKDLLFGELKNGGCENICNFLFKEFKINNKLEKYGSNDNEMILKEKLIEQENDIGILNNIIKEQATTINKLNESKEELEDIKNSKGWIILEKIKRIIYYNKFRKIEKNKIKK